MTDWRANPTYCADQARRFDRDRYLCALFAPAARRQALFALTAFNLELARIREAVSEALLGRIRLQWWREAIAGIFEGAPQHHQVIAPLAAAVAAHGLSRGHFDRLIEAREFDLDGRPPANLGALVDYAEGTSSTLVLLVLEALGSREPEAIEAGRQVGIAWALVGLMRAVPFHAQARRLYLPADMCAEAGVDIGEIFELRTSPQACAVIERLAQTAHQHLRAAREHRRAVPKAALPALLPAVLADGYLADIEKAGYDVFQVPVNAAPRTWRLALSRLSGRF